MSFLFSTGAISGQEIHRQRFLVEGDPIPPALYIRGSAEEAGRFRKESSWEEHPFFRSDESRSSYLLRRQVWNRAGFPLNEDPVSDQVSLVVRNRNRERARAGNIESEALVLPLVSNQRMLLVSGPGYMEETFFDQKNHTLPSRMSGVYWSLFGTGSIGESFYWFSYHSAGSFSASPSVAERKSYTYYQLSTAGWKPNSSLSLQGGLLLKTMHGETVALPVAGIAWGNGTVVAKLLLPAGAEFRWIVHPAFHLLAEAKARSSSYFVAGGGSYGIYSDSLTRSNLENHFMEENRWIERRVPVQPLWYGDPVAWKQWDLLRKQTAPDSFYELSREEVRLGAEIRLGPWTWLQLSALYHTAIRVRKREGKEWYDAGSVAPGIRAEFALILRP